MLFLQDNLRITSSTLAIIPYVDLRYRSVDANDLVDIQSVVAYFYAAPRHTFGELFLSPEHASRLTDSNSLLLGRTPRLDVWARQFYDARSRIVHEGRAHQLRFIATDARKTAEGPLYQKLISYGRQVFQLCLGTLLTGAALAERAGLADTLVTNEERFQRICKALADEKVAARERLDQILSIVVALEQYRYVPETDLKVATMIGATRLAARAALAAAADVSGEFKTALEGLINARAPINHLEELEAIAALKRLLDHDRRSNLIEATESFVRLIDVVYSYSMMHYYWLKEQLRIASPSET